MAAQFRYINTQAVALLSAHEPVTVRTIGDGSGILKGEPAPWGVQVAGNFSLERALESFDAAQRQGNRAKESCGDEACEKVVVPGSDLSLET